MWPSITHTLPAHGPMSQVRRYVFTINNYTDEDINRLSNLDDRVDYLVFGRETGESGTPHLQGFVIFSRSLRFDKAKELLGDRAHLEVARGLSIQASDYCKKDGDFKEIGSLPKNQGKRKDWDQFKEYVQELGRPPSDLEIARSFPHLYARYSSKCKYIGQSFLPPPRLTTGSPRFGWQGRIDAVLQSPPSPRSIYFVVDPEGNSGKSWMCQYALTKWPEKTQVLRIGKRDDLAFSIDETKSIFLFDVPRNQMTFLQYSVLESLKDRMIFSPKYASALKILYTVPHVVVFCNEAPDMDALTSDRYKIINVG